MPVHRPVQRPHCSARIGAQSRTAGDQDFIKVCHPGDKIINLCKCRKSCPRRRLIDQSESQFPGLETAALKLESAGLNPATRGQITESAKPGAESPIRHSESSAPGLESRTPGLVTQKSNFESQFQGVGPLAVDVAASISRASSALTSPPSRDFASARRVASASSAGWCRDSSPVANASAATSLASTC